MASETVMLLELLYVVLMGRLFTKNPERINWNGYPPTPPSLNG